MRILFYGAGVLGSLYAARLHEAGHEVAVLARGRRREEIGKHGVVLWEVGSDEQTVTEVPVVDRLVPEDDYDLVVVMVRSHQLLSVLQALADSGSTGDVLFMLNDVSGPQRLVEVLGRERVLLGFPGAGGWRQGHTVRFFAGPPWLQRIQSTTFGELDGGVSPRLEQVMEVFQGAGFPVAVNSNMDAWLKTHAAVMVPLAAAVHATGGDARRLSRTPDALVLTVRAVQENLAVLHALGVPVTPAGLRALGWLPERALVVLFRRLLRTKTAAMGLQPHATAAADETGQLAEDLRQLAQTAGVPTPAADRLREYLDTATAPIPEGSAQIPGKRLRAVSVVALLRGAGQQPAGLCRDWGGGGRVRGHRRTCEPGVATGSRRSSSTWCSPT